MPDWISDIRAKLAGVRISAADEANVTEELQQHLDDRYNELRSKGTPEAEARRIALEELGEDDFLEGRMRGAIRPPNEPVPLGAAEGKGLAGLWGDLRFGARMLRRSPGFTITAALTIALGIGANTTIFSIVNAVLLQPLAGTARTGELVMIGRTQEGQGFDTFSYPDYLDYSSARSLTSVAAVTNAPAHLSTGGASERARVEIVSGNYFTTLGTRAAHGRLFTTEDDDAPGANPVVVLGHGVWQRRFGSDASVIGKPISVNGSPYTVIGVAEAGFNGTRIGGVIDLFVPIAMAGTLLPDYAPMRAQRGAVWLNFFGRLAPGVTPQAAQAELSAIASDLARRFAETNQGRGVRIATGMGLDPSSRSDITTFMSVLSGVVALVLLIACANVANLLLARGTARAREMAVRASLGASRARLVRQLLAEGFLVAIVGGATGLLLGAWSLRLVLKLPVFVGAYSGLSVKVDPVVLSFAIGAMVLSGILFALPPAFRATRVDLVAGLKLGTPGSGDGRSRLRNGLVIAQLALSLVLLIAAGLYLRTLQALYRVEPGFDTQQVLVGVVDAGLQGYDEPRGRRLFDDLEQRVSAIPGVQQAAVGYMLPLGGGGWDTRLFAAETTPAPTDEGLKSDVNSVSPSYFETLGMPIIKGRGFTAADRDGAPGVAVINEVIAERLWPGVDPIGRGFRLGRQGREVLEVVGVVRTGRYRTLVEAPRPFLYRPFAQVYRASMTLHVRTAQGDPYAVLPAVRRALEGLDKDLPLSRVQTLRERLDRSVGSQRTAATLVGLYGVVALLLAAVGLYGSMAHSVSRRTREMGIRMALGARSGEVLRVVLGQAMRIAAIGAVVGLAASVPATRYLKSQLFGVQSTDPATLVAVLIVLISAAIAAAYLPARRATRVDPVVALRSE